MKTVWTQNIKDPEERDKFVNKILSSREVLERLTNILREFEKSLDKSELDLKAYETPNWDYVQAHKNGYRACLYRIKDLISLDQRNVKDE